MKKWAQYCVMASSQSKTPGKFCWTISRNRPRSSLSLKTCFFSSLSRLFWKLKTRNLVVLQTFYFISRVSFFVIIFPTVPEYDVVHPVLLNDQGDFLSHDVTHDNKREAPKNLNFGVSAFGKRYHLNMKLNTDHLLAPGFVTEIRNNGESRYDRSVDHCHYLGHLVTDQGPGDKVALSNCDDGLVRVKRGLI